MTHAAEYLAQLCHRECGSDVAQLGMVRVMVCPRRTPSPPALAAASRNWPLFYAELGALCTLYSKSGIRHMRRLMSLISATRAGRRVRLVKMSIVSGLVRETKMFSSCYFGKELGTSSLSANSSRVSAVTGGGEGGGRGGVGRFILDHVHPPRFQLLTTCLRRRLPFPYHVLSAW
jgi:hypothetical protein